MIKNLSKSKIKSYLIRANVALALALVSLIIYWFAFARPAAIAKATEIKQYYSFSMQNLPAAAGEIQANYLGPQPTRAKVLGDNRGVDINNDGRDYKTDDRSKDEQYKTSTRPPSPPPPTGKTKQDKLIEQTEEMLIKSDRLLSDDNKIHVHSENKPIGKPKISIIITNLGLSRRSTELALTLPPQCALGFLPYTRNLRPLLGRAQINGHEIYIYLPLQTDHLSEKPDKYALMHNLPPEENASRLNAILNSQQHFTGVYSSYKEIFTNDLQISELIFDHMHDKDLIFILGRGLNESLKKDLDRYNNVIPTNIVLDKEPDRESIGKQLEILVDIAQKEGIALGYAQGFTLSMEIIKEWIPTLAKRGIELVPVSELLKEYNS